MLERDFAPKKREDNTFSPSFFGAIHFLLGVSFFFVCFGRLSGCLDIGAHASGNLQRVDGGVYNRVIRLLQVAICVIFTLPKKKFRDPGPFSSSPHLYVVSHSIYCQEARPQSQCIKPFNPKATYPNRFYWSFCFVFFL